MRRYLVVANQTLGGERLQEEILRRVRDAPCRFHLLVPATRPADLALRDGNDASAVAARRLEVALSRLHGLGILTTGEVGDENPLRAVAEMLLRERFDEIIISTLPAGVSRWVRLDFPDRLSGRTGIPVTHVVSEPDPVFGTAGRVGV